MITDGSVISMHFNTPIIFITLHGRNLSPTSGASSVAVDPLRPSETAWIHGRPSKLCSRRNPVLSPSHVNTVLMPRPWLLLFWFFCWSQAYEERFDGGWFQEGDLFLFLT